MRMVLSGSINQFEKAIMFDEINDQALTKASVKLLLNSESKVALNLAEKLAGCQARLRSRST